VISTLTGVSICGVAQMVNPTLSSLKGVLGVLKERDITGTPSLAPFTATQRGYAGGAHFFVAPNLHTTPLLNFENQAFF
jgi:hypothetical protein